MKAEGFEISAHSFSHSDLTKKKKGEGDKAYLEKGRAYDAKWDKNSALRQYKLASTIDPSNEEAVKNRNRPEKAQRDSAEAHYKKGLKYNEDGKFSLARRQFLFALRLWPDYRVPGRMLTSRKRFRIKKYLTQGQAG